MDKDKIDSIVASVAGARVSREVFKSLQGQYTAFVLDALQVTDPVERINAVAIAAQIGESTIECMQADTLSARGGLAAILLAAVLPMAVSQRTREVVASQPSLQTPPSIDDVLAGVRQAAQFAHDHLTARPASMEKAQ